MTATVSADARHDVLTTRLAALYHEREQVLAEIAPAGSGDDADRATNVDGHIRLAMLEQRIVALETELAEPRPAARPRKGTRSSTVALGDVVTVDLGDGPETYLLGSVDEAGAGYDVITPSSPLGRVLEGAKAGATLTYSPRPGRTLTATVVSIG
jgi:transcription elongation factor GreA